MSELRWILLALGLVVLAGVYLWSRRRAGRQEAMDEGGYRREPTLDTRPPWDRIAPTDSRQPAESGRTAPAATRPEAVPTGKRPMEQSEMELPEPQRGEREEASGEPEKILVVHVRAAPGEVFHGPDLEQVFQAEGLVYGKHGAYNLLDGRGRSLFTVASMVEPGTFPEEGLEDFTTRGLSMFMVLPGAGDADTLARMIACARRMASRLEGEVLDDSGSTLTNQRATHMREEIIEFQRRRQISPVGGEPSGRR